MSSYTHKIGDTFALGGSFAYTDAAGTALDPTGIVGKSQLRTRAGSLIADLDVTISGTTGNAAITIKQKPGADSSTWPVGVAELDVQCTLSSGDVISTETASVLLVRDVTRSTP